MSTLNIGGMSKSIGDSYSSLKEWNLSPELKL
jgi:hypothetical protein